MKFKPGQTHHVYQPSCSGWSFYKIHILAIVDNNQVVYKWFGKHRRYWRYEVSRDDFLEQKIELAKKKRKELYK